MLSPRLQELKHRKVKLLSQEMGPWHVAGLGQVFSLLFQQGHKIHKKHHRCSTRD